MNLTKSPRIGSFEVMDKDGNLLHSKLESGRYPDWDKLIGELGNKRDPRFKLKSSVKANVEV